RPEFPEAPYLERQSGSELAACYGGADVCVLPCGAGSFGRVMVGARAWGTPVAAYALTGPGGVLPHGGGPLAEALVLASVTAPLTSREACIAHGSQFTWGASARQFLEALAWPPEAERLPGAVPQAA